MNLNFRHFWPLLFAMLLVCATVTDISAQRREHLTAEEIELVRDVQEVDLRMEVFIYAVERRLWVIEGTENLTAEQKKRIEKDSEKWGELPKGTNFELYSDIEKILDEAIDKLEDVFEREPENDLIPYAIYLIGDYSEALIPKLEGLSGKTQIPGELSLLRTSKVHCSGILEAREKFTRPTVKRKDRKKKNT